MAYTSGFFDAIDQGGGNYDRVYSAANFAHYFSLLVQNGVFPDPSTGMQVKASSSPDMHVSVQPGSGWVNGYYVTVEASAPEQLTVPTANPSLSRIDSVIMGLNYVQREIQLYIKSGAVSASPSAVSLQRDNDLYELELAQITVSAGMASITQSSITDMRSNTSRCGIVKGMVDQIDTTDLFAQYDTAFQEWFDDIKAQLSGNVATNLQNQINTLKIEKLGESDKATTAQAQSGTDNTKWMTPALVKAFYDAFKASQSEAEAGTISTKWMSPLTAKKQLEKLGPFVNGILSTETKALYGLSSAKTPNDVFSLLSRFNSGLGNEYLWRKDTYGPYKEKRIGPFSDTDWNAFPADVYYGTGISISDTGVVTLLNPVKTGNNAATVAEQIRGKYIQWFKEGVRYVQSATAKNGQIDHTFYKITADRQIASSTWLNSPSLTGYSEGGSGNEVYTFLGNIGSCAHIEVGSYIGTGSAQSITLPFVPRLMFINYKLVSFSVSGKTATISTYISTGQTYSYICIGGS